MFWFLFARNIFNDTYIACKHSYITYQTEISFFAERIKENKAEIKCREWWQPQFLFVFFLSCMFVFITSIWLPLLLSWLHMSSYALVMIPDSRLFHSLSIFRLRFASAFDALNMCNTVYPIARLICSHFSVFVYVWGCMCVSFEICTLRHNFALPLSRGDSPTIELGKLAKIVRK